MKRTLYLLITILFFLTTKQAGAEEISGVPKKYSASVEGGYRLTNGDEKSALFSEYEDLSSRVLFNFDLNYYNEGYHSKLEGKNLLADDLEVSYNGGKYSRYKYNLYYKQAVHNLSMKAKSFYATVDSDTLTYTATDRAINTDTAYTPNISTDINTWDEFDYAIKKTKTGLKIFADFDRPFFFGFDAELVRDKGLKPSSAASGMFYDKRGVQTSSFGSAFEVPEPIDQSTLNTALTFGYRTKRFFLSIEGSLSNFNNKYDSLTFRDPYVTTKVFDTVASLPPDNTFLNYQLKFSASKLPFDSTFNTTLSESRLKTDVSLLNTIANSTSGMASTSPTYSITTLTLSTDKFKGDVTYDNAAISWLANPTKSWDTLLYFRYLNKKNESNSVTFTNGTSSTESILFKYQKRDLGFDTGLKLPAKTKLNSGVNYLELTRSERNDAHSTKDNDFFVTLKNDYFDWASIKLKLNYLDRSSVFYNDSVGASTSSSNYIGRYQHRFDATDKWQSGIKLGFDLNPMDNLDIGLEVSQKKNDYKITRIGLSKDQREEVYLDASLLLPEIAQIDLFADIEVSKADSSHRNFSTNGNPLTSATATNYNWFSERKNVNFLFGLKLDIPVIDEKLDLGLSLNYEESDGMAEFSSQDNVKSFEDISLFGDYIKTSLSGKLRYTHNRKLSVTLGYLHARMDVQDAQFNDYEADFTNRTILGGAYSDSDFSVDIGYLTAAYSF